MVERVNLEDSFECKIFNSLTMKSNHQADYENLIVHPRVVHALMNQVKLYIEKRDHRFE